MISRSKQRVRSDDILLEHNQEYSAEDADVIDGEANNG